MVTQAYIQTIRESASFWAPYDQANGVMSLKAYLQAGLPDWAADPDDLLSRALPFMVEWNRLQSETPKRSNAGASCPTPRATTWTCWAWALPRCCGLPAKRTTTTGCASPTPAWA